MPAFFNWYCFFSCFLFYHTIQPISTQVLKINILLVLTHTHTSRKTFNTSFQIVVHQQQPISTTKTKIRILNAKKYTLFVVFMKKKRVCCCSSSSSSSRVHSPRSLWKRMLLNYFFYFYFLFHKCVCLFPFFFPPK